MGREWELADAFPCESGFCPYGELHEVAFFFFGRDAAGAELFLQEGFVDGRAAKEAAGDVGDG